MGGAVCLNGTGYSQAYEGTLFTSLVYRQDGGSPIVSPTISGADFSGANLIWGQNYVVDFNDDIDMSDPIAGQRILDTGVLGGSYTCGQDASFDLDENIVDAYSNVPQIEIDYSGVKDQECWYQVRGGSILAGNNIDESIPLTCASSPGCVNALNIDNTGMDDNGLVLTNSKTNIVGCSNCLSGHDNDWYKTGYSQNMRIKSYREMYNDLYVGKGVGRLADNWLEVLDIGGTGLVFVDGDLTINSNNSLTDSQFLMVVVNGTININDGVNQVEGVFRADGDLIIGGNSDLALEINGMVYANNIQISRSFSNRADNNSSPAVVFNYSPGLIFTAPVYMFEKFRLSR